MVDPSIPYERLFMIRANLEDIPRYEFPEGYRVRPYRSGDYETWWKIHDLTYNLTGDPGKVTRETHAKQFGTDEEELSRRQLFIVSPKGEDIGTATAWSDADYHGGKWGQVHWVAIVPGHQGKGLSKPLMTAVLERLRESGETRVYLGTQTSRIAAVSLYLKFGFTPDIRTDEDLAAWELLRGRLSHPAIEDLRLTTGD